MQLSGNNIEKIKQHESLALPSKEMLSLPERVIQFGTGVLLRGLPDYFIDKANRQGIFNGRIVVVKSTAHGDTTAFSEQDCLYTLCVKGIEKGRPVDERIIISSISRVLTANEEWDEVLSCARNSEIQIVISNTTEVGITLVMEDIGQSPPSSFPAKLLAYLHERYKTFNGSVESGMVIVPTELIPNNGAKLFSILLQLAEFNSLESGFIDWLYSCNHFCDSLVDRIVPGRLTSAMQQQEERELGYTDKLMIMAESFRLWAIESSNRHVRELLSFAHADEGVVIADDITKFRELKLRLLNGTHSFCCGIALLAGYQTVKEAMEEEEFSTFVSELMKQEIIPAVVGEKVTEQEAIEFAGMVLDRFRNPFLEHKWVDISVQYTSKMRMRNVQLVQQYVSRIGIVPKLMSLGFAGYLLLMKTERENEKFIAHVKGNKFSINDDKAGYFSEKWAMNGKFAETVLADAEIWGTSLAAIPGFTESVVRNIDVVQRLGAKDAIRQQALSKSKTG